jgi:hypothetical protein
VLHGRVRLPSARCAGHPGAKIDEFVQGGGAAASQAVGMNGPHFAFLFRAERPVSAADLPRRNAAAREWALARGAEGTLRAASPLEDAGAVIAASGVAAAPREPAVAAVLIVAAPDLNAAIALAQTHPGLAFGTSIEVRPVKPTPARAPRP